LTFTFGEDGQTDNPYAADYIRAWAFNKYREELKLDEIRTMPVRRLRDRLIGMQEQFLADGKLEREVDQILEANSQPETLAKAMNDRFDARLTGDAIAETTDAQGGRGEARSRLDGSDDDTAPETVRERMLRLARTFLRRELTDLEQFVLIQIFDQSWKDHLYAMDMLRSGIGLQAFAERDPRIMYKKEGYRYFQEMMEGIRDKVTNLIFRARIVGVAQARSAYQVTAASHEQSGGYGVGENVRATSKMLGEGKPQPGREEGEAVHSDGPTTVVKPIVRETPKVGRNDPCPCGSGKKYKKCCGAGK